MEALAQKLQDAFTLTGQSIAVYLGSEWLVKQPTLPHVIVVPGGGTYGPPDGSVRGGIASLTTEPHLICKAALFEEAALLADFCYAALATGQSARVTLRSEVWGEYTVRVADLTLTLPATLTRDDIARVRVLNFIQHAHFAPAFPTPEVPDDQTNPTGSTVFE